MDIVITGYKDIEPYLSSPDYKERLIGEIIELELRIHKLEAMLKQSDEERGFSFKSPIHLLEAQLENMSALHNILEIRAILEDVALPEVKYEV